MNCSFMQGECEVTLKSGALSAAIEPPGAQCLAAFTQNNTACVRQPCGFWGRCGGKHAERVKMGGFFTTYGL
ncbi:hypothetical protein LB506_003627 [Fusarium annulatum]|nr:hypothetical protein LB506_003627 [Fusarium annulatum]